MATPLNTAQLARAIDLAALAGPDGAPPKEVCLFTAGDVDTTKGTFRFTANSALSVIKQHQEYGNDLMFDYDHASVGMFSMDPAEAGKAAGWFTPEVRAGALWAANIRWTPTAAKKLLDREYRYVSPTFRHSEDGEVLELINAALTNMPATKKMAPIMASRKEQETMDLSKLTSALGLADTASLDECVATAVALNQARDQVAALSKEVSDLKAEKVRAEVALMVDAGQRDGKIPPALADWAKTQSADSLKAYLAAAPAIKTESAKPPKADADPVSEGVVVLTKIEKQFAKSAGVSEEAALARKKALIEKRAAATDEADED